MLTRLGMAVSLFLFLTACGDMDVVDEHYADGTQARRAPGSATWLPQWVPATAEDIHDVHNTDTGQQTLRFTVPLRAVDLMVSNLKPLVIDGRDATRALAAALDWDTRSDHAVKAYIDCDRHKGVLFVDYAMGRALFRHGGESATKSCPEREVLNSR